MKVSLTPTPRVWTKTGVVPFLSFLSSSIRTTNDVWCFLNGSCHVPCWVGDVAFERMVNRLVPGPQALWFKEWWMRNHTPSKGSEMWRRV